MAPNRDFFPGFPCPAGKLRRYRAMSSGIPICWSTRGSTEERADDFAGWHDDIHDLIRSTSSLYKWALMVRELMERWSVGRVTLLGDACHPILAQSAVMAIEDGFTLARCCERLPDDVATAFDRYERACSERTQAIVLVPPPTRGGSTIPHSPTPSAPRGISTASGAASRSPAATSGCSPTMSSAPRSDRQGLFGPWRSWWPALLISISARSAAWHRRAPPIRCRRPSRDPPRTGH